ncbi:MAG TPA: TonB family protein [Planctomycetaceae bacterium]|nr:TonB family protein [Planctomycetaceae bacterium]
MRTRLSFAVSASTHALLLGALAVADDWLITPPAFAVRAGNGTPIFSFASRARTAPFPMDTQLDAPDNEPIEIATPASPQPQAPKPSPTAADLDHRAVHRPTADSVAFQRTERGFATEASTQSVPEPLDLAEVSVDVVAADVVVENIASAPSSSVRVNDLEAPQPERVEAPTQRTVAIAKPAVIGDVIQDGNGNVNSIAASIPAGAQVDQLPSALPLNAQPVYPEALRRRQIGGQVLLRVAIGPDGRVENVRVEKSSGHRELDQSAETAVRTWRFAPAQWGKQPVRTEVRLPITFSIRRG